MTPSTVGTSWFRKPLPNNSKVVFQESLNEPTCLNIRPPSIDRADGVQRVGYICRVEQQQLIASTRSVDVPRQRDAGGEPELVVASATGEVLDAAEGAGDVGHSTLIGSGDVPGVVAVGLGDRVAEDLSAAVNVAGVWSWC